ncbi:NDUFA12-domain-containing protein [Neoconidiobolus thromboides FSU 785]|nr:NDUFA12-domain-containing protein [Neoconidiobolus thromboides FSU 785]
MASLGQWVRKFKSSWDLKRTFNQLWVIKDVKGGVYVGKDALGNRYYEDNDETWARHRHVEYAAYDYDPSQVPAKWRNWLHFTNSTVPKPDQELTPMYKWVTTKHVENVTGTPKAYKPYSTTKSKFESWEPKVQERV